MSPEVRRSCIFLGIALAAFILNSLRTNRSTNSNLAAGFILWQAFDSWIDLAVYPIVLLWLGAKFGFAAMFFLTLAINLTYVKINNSTETDWTLMEHFLSLSWVKKLNEWKWKRMYIGKSLGFLICSFKFDSFYAVNFLYGKKVDFKRPAVILLFLTSHAACNVAWTYFWEVVFVSWKALIGFL